MCEEMKCTRFKEDLCSCLAGRKKDSKFLKFQVSQCIQDIHWELEYTTLMEPEKRRLCLVGKCIHCGGRLCVPLHTGDDLIGAELLAALYRELHDVRDCHLEKIPYVEFRTRFVQMFHEQDRGFVRKWLKRPENQSVKSMGKDCNQPYAIPKTAYAIVLSACDVKIGIFDPPVVKYVFTLLPEAQQVLRRLANDERQTLVLCCDDADRCEEEDDMHWMVYERGRQMLNYIRLDILTIELQPGDDVDMNGCHFTNTRSNLSDCLTALWHEVRLSDSEVRAGRNMFLDFLEFCEERELIPSFDKAEVTALFNGLRERAGE